MLNFTGKCYTKLITLFTFGESKGLNNREVSFDVVKWSTGSLHFFKHMHTFLAKNIIDTIKSLDFKHVNRLKKPGFGC